MIKLTYEFFCDLCSEKCGVEEYKCINHTSSIFPRPKSDFSYYLQTQQLELCNDCAAPLVKTLSESIRKRGKT